MGMAITLDIFDRSVSQMVGQEAVMQLLFDSETITANELIHRRVEHEFEQFQAAGTFPKSLIPLGGTEADSSLEAYCQSALELFEKNGYFIIVDDRQITELDEKLTLRKESLIEFYRLTNLVGG